MNQLSEKNINVGMGSVSLKDLLSYISIPFETRTGAEVLTIGLVAKPAQLIGILGSNKHDLWSHVWASSFLTSEMLLDADITGLKTLDLGAGTGLATVAARKQNANVLACDFHALSLELISINAKLNSVDVKSEVFNWHNEVPGKWKEAPFDLILCSDVLYMQSAVGCVLKLIKETLKDDGTALIVDPGRPNVYDFTDKARDMGFNILHKTLSDVQTPLCGMKLVHVVLLSKQEVSKTLAEALNALELRRASRNDISFYGYCA